jgi:hypothetical protein
MLINGLPVSSLFFYTSLLCLHQCLPSRIFLSFMFFFFVSSCAPQISLLLSDMHRLASMLCSFLPALNTQFRLASLFPFILCAAYACYFYTIDLPFRLCTMSHTPHMDHHRKGLLVSSILHVFIMPSSFYDHHCNSSSSLEVILILFIISGHYAKIL